MFECLMGLSLGAGSLVLPEDTGPGPTELIGYHLTNGGTKQAGFFGEVTTDELITGSGLASLIGLTAGIAQYDTDPWLKFFIDDKIVFVAKRPHRHSISWDHINAVNAVYGNRIVEIQGYQFKVRLLQGINPGETTAAVSGFDLPVTHRSEWNRLFYPIVENNASYPKTSQIGLNWVTYTEAELGIGGSLNGRATWCQETPSFYPTMRAYRGNYAVSILDWAASSLANTNFGWRPVLELVTD